MKYLNLNVLFKSKFVPKSATVYLVKASFSF